MLNKEYSLNYHNTVAADIFVACLPRISNRGIGSAGWTDPSLVFHEEGFHWWSLSKGWEMIENANDVLGFLIYIQNDDGWY